MEKYHLKLTDEEEALLKQIDLRDHHVSHDEGRASYLANREPIVALIRSLAERGAIPEERQKYWLDPAYKSGHTKGSRKQMFEKNGNVDAVIYEHPNFLKHLRYFLFGADLPDAFIADFERRIADPRWFSSSDVVPAMTVARELTRRYRLNPHDAAEEFFKLCLDMGLGLYAAQAIAKTVRGVKLR